MYYSSYDDSDNSEWISAETADIPPHPSETHRPTLNTHHRPNRRREPSISFAEAIAILLAGIWDAIIRIRNVIVYIILFFVSVFIWPIGVFLLVCLLVWIFRG